MVVNAVGSFLPKRSKFVRQMYGRINHDIQDKRYFDFYRTLIELINIQERHFCIVDIGSTAGGGGGYFSFG